MPRTAFLLTLILTALASMSAHAQSLRVFVSGLGSDTNPCTVTKPCRTFQQAYNTAPPYGEINVLDPAGYGTLTILSHGISIQGHGFGAITATSGAAIYIQPTTSDPVMLNGLVIDGGGTGTNGIFVSSGPSVQILNSVVRGFNVGISNNTITNGATLLIEDTIVSDNQTGIQSDHNGLGALTTLSRITANNNQVGVNTGGANQSLTIANSVLSNNNIGLQNLTGPIRLSKTVISGNGTGVSVSLGTVYSYGDNYINDNATPLVGSLTPVSMQ
jgi:hypothetical protein